MDLLPPTPARVLDIGAGTGRQAAWLQSQGFDVTATDPVPELRTHDLNWQAASLPRLSGLGPAFDLILISAVWHHLSPPERLASWPRLAKLLTSGGVVLMSLRHGPTAADRPGFDIGAQTEAHHAAAHGLSRRAIRKTASVQAENRALGVHWAWLALRQSGAKCGAVQTRSG